MFEREVNPHAVREAEIVVVIPSYNEADSIDYPTRMASEGLALYFPDRKSVIINADAASPDGTQAVFLATETAVPKIYITTPGDVSGKGWCFANAWRKACHLGAKAVICVDADLRSITPEWMLHMASPILELGYDYLTPLYSRHKYDGTITNNICYPLIHGLFGRDVRQPIGGDFALSSRLVRHLLTVPWSRTTYQYGVDIFMTMQALLGGFQVGQVGLGAKIHKPSAPKLGPMFVQVVSTALRTVSANFDEWKKVRSVAEAHVFGLTELAPAQDLEVDRAAICRKAVDEFGQGVAVLRAELSGAVVARLTDTFDDIAGPEIDTEFWIDVLFDLIVAFSRSQNPVRLVESTRGLYFGRVFSFMNQTWDLTSAECEQPIRQQGVRLFERRGELIRRLEAGQ